MKRHLPALAIALLATATLVEAGIWYEQRALHHRLAISLSAEAQVVAKEAEAKERRDFAKRAALFLSSEAGRTLSPSRWGTQDVQVRQTKLERGAAFEILSQARRDQSYIFGLDSIDISVTNPDGGLFSKPKTGRDELVVTLVGKALFRVSEGAK